MYTTYNPLKTTITPPKAFSPFSKEYSGSYSALTEQFFKRRKRQHWRNIYSATLKSGSILLCIPFLFSPVVIRKTTQLARKPIFQNKPKTLAVLKHLSDSKRFNDLYWRISSILSLSMLSYLQISLNTNQPSKLMSEMIALPLAAIQLFRPSRVLRSLTFVCPVFWFTGERNDFENGNHLENRREWNLRRLKHPKEWGSFTRFVGKDLSYTLSFKPWKDLFPGKKQESSATSKSLPKANQASLAAQFSLLSALTGLLMKEGKVKNIITISSGMAGALFSQLPVDARAWQSRREVDGILPLIGSPFMIVGKAFALLGSLNYLSAMVTIGAPLVTEGKRRNSVKYRNMLDYFKLLSQNSYQNPNLTASGVLNYMAANPDTVKTLRQLVGELRFQFIVAHLKKASLANAPLWQYLSPMLQSLTLPGT